jgi:hypothetical protein
MKPISGERIQEEQIPGERRLKERRPAITDKAAKHLRELTALKGYICSEI